MSSGNPQESAVNVKPSIAVGRALSLLDAFLDAGHTMSLTELAQLTSLPKSTAFRILGQLTASGHVIRNGNQYRLGIKMFELGNHFVHSRPTGLKEVAAPLLGDLFLHVGATVGLSVLESWDVILIDQITSSRSRIVTPVVGGRAPALSTASGKALVAFLDTENRERAVAHHVRQEPCSSRTVRHAGRLRSQLAEVRENGHSWACDEFSMGMSAVASPVLVNGRPIAAVSVSAATGRFDRAKAAAAVLRTSRLIATQFIRARELAQDYSTSELQWDIEDEFDRVS